MLIFWIILIAVVSFIWAVVSLLRERGRKEMEKAKEEIAKGRVIFHSSSSEDSTSKS